MTNYQLFDSLLEPVFILNQEGQVVYCNETASLMAGSSIRKLVRSQSRLDEILIFESPIEYLSHLSEVTDPTPYREINFTNLNGDQGKVQITAQPLTPSSDLPAQHWIVFVRDVTLEERLQKKYRAELEQKEEFIKHLEQAQERLKEYSEKLEVMVADRTAQLSHLNHLMAALLDSLNQGFFIFDKSGQVLEISSKACLEVIEGNPQGKMIWETLRLPESKVESFKKWMTTLFGELLPFEDLAPLGPPTFPHSQGKNIQLDYFPMRNEGLIQGVVVVASDITSLVEAQRQAEYEKTHAQLIIKLIRSKREISRFIRDADDLLHHLHEEMNRPEGPDQENSFRYLHTLKGGAATFSITPVAEKAHEAESILVENPKSKILSQKIDEIDQAYKEFVSEAQEIIGHQIQSNERWVEIPSSEIRNWASYLSQIPGGHQFAAELRHQYLSEPIAPYFLAFENLCERLSEKENKPKPRIQIDDHNIRINPEIYSSLFSTFVHAFRNSLDHGIEYPSVREACGKNPEGLIQVHFDLLENGQLRILFQDDGRGLDSAKLRAKMEEKGLAHKHLSDHEVNQIIFKPQLSTKEEVTETSGRGVGMDAILFAAQELGGKAWVESKPNQGMQLYVEVPYFFERKTATHKVAA